MPTSWNVTPHRDEHGYPATMTGDDGMEVLDLDMELDEHALRVFQLHSQPWLKARLQFYKEKSDALWRRRRNGSRHRNRVSQVVAEILLRQVGKDLEDMELSSEAHGRTKSLHAHCLLGNSFSGIFQLSPRRDPCSARIIDPVAAALQSLLRSAAVP